MEYRDWKIKAKTQLQLSDYYREDAVYWLNVLLDELACGLLLPSLEPEDSRNQLHKLDLDSKSLAKLDYGVKSLMQGEPLALLTGYTYFYGLKILCFPDVLIPRPDSETLVESAGKYLLKQDLPTQVLEIGTGSACLSLALIEAIKPKTIDLIATDISPAAIQAAKANVELHDAEGSIRIEKADLWPESLRTRSFQPTVVLSNPPYLSTEELTESRLSQWEPETALVAGTDGLDYYRRILQEGAFLLPLSCVLLLEHGFGQSQAIRSLAHEADGWEYLETICDLADRPRVTVLHRKDKE